MEKQRLIGSWKKEQDL